MAYFTGKGYGISDITDITGRPLLTYQGPDDKKPILLADRVAQEFDFTIKQNLTAGAMRNDRMDSAMASKAKKILGGGSDDELDHKISLELGGSNTPANLWIQTGITSGASAASDTLENNLALDVVAGKISLLDAWRILEEQKGFLLVEDIQKGNKEGIASLMFQLAGNLKDYITGKISIGTNKPDANLKTKMDQLLADLAANQLDQPKMNQLIQTQVDSIQKQTGSTTTEAAKITKTILSAYAETKGIDPREIIGATNLNIQKIIKNSKTDPNIFGLSSTAILKFIGLLQSATTGGVIVGVILAVIGIALAGPEAVVGALSGGLLESIGSIFGVSFLTGLGLTTFAVSEALNVAFMGIGQTIKSTYDNGYLLPTQQISALKDVLAIQKGLAGFLPSEAKPKTSTPTSGGGNGASAVTKVFTGVISSGTLGAGLTFTPRQDDLIQSIDDLKQAIANNLAPFLAALPSKIVYEVKIASSVTTKDGLKQKGTTQQIISGYAKNGTAKYKTVINKFATLSLYISTDKGTKSKISTIILGPTDAIKFQPKQDEINALQLDTQKNIITSNVSDISSIHTTTPITIQSPAQAILAPAPPPTAIPVTPSQISVPAISTQTSAPISTVDLTTLKSRLDQATNYYNTGMNPPPGTTGQGYVEMVAAQKAYDEALAKTPQPAVTMTSSQETAKQKATTLSEFYSAIGQQLPSISDRAAYYEFLGLGKAAYYTGTAEQNTKLLAKLQGK